MTEEFSPQTEHFFRAVLDAVQTGIVVIDAEKREIVDANPAALRMIGAPRERVIGSACHRYICPADQGQCPVCDLGQSVDNSERMLLKDNGEELPILKTVVPKTLGDRRYLIESFVDISDRRQVEESLAQERDLLQALMDNVPDMIFFKDAQSRVIRSNKAHARLLGFDDPQEAIGKTDFDFFAPEDAPGFYE
jgi:PAS domain S-box-containing protein